MQTTGYTQELEGHFARKRLKEPAHFWKKIPWTDETKVNLYECDGCTRLRFSLIGQCFIVDR